MAEREHVLVALFEEVLGPRDGINEILTETENPRDEYITGVLAPAQAAKEEDNIDAEAEDLVEEISSEEDQDSQGAIVVPGTFAPALNPKELPRSIGLSFTIESDKVPEIEICTTWARYQQVQKGWKRHPEYYLTGRVQVDKSQSWDASKGISLQLRSRKLFNGTYRVSIFLVNVTPISKQNGRADTPDYLFQPQIRVICCPDTELVPVQSAASLSATGSIPGSMAEEDASLALLYRKRTAMARGHLCGVTWREIDPERPHPTLPSPLKPPFAWMDGALLPIAEQQKFSPADVRTELLPCYPIEVPQMDWDAVQHGNSPTLDPEILAETWLPDDIRRNLQPLVDGYLTWLGSQTTLVSALPQHQQMTARHHLQQCEQAAQRIQDAIEVLATDEEARLAFCFANKAIALQSQWRRGKALQWRPFQLAFILLNIPALTDLLHADRQTCDLLWFPTGGGKTEAYLGLAAFVLALRRRQGKKQNQGHNSGAGVGVLSRYTLRLLTIQQFRRALGVITACEFLRVYNLDNPNFPAGWRPQSSLNKEHFLWGGIRFSAGLWVGGSVTPNNLLSFGPLPTPNGLTWFVGAIDSLKGVTCKGYEGPDYRLQKNSQNASRREISGEPAQVLNCPCCDSILAVPDEGLSAGKHVLHFVIKGGRSTTPPIGALSPAGSRITIDSATFVNHRSNGYRTFSLAFTVPHDAALKASDIDKWWYDTIQSVLGQQASLVAARPARPGYFMLSYQTSQKSWVDYDFDIYCPNSACSLNQQVWAEAVPMSAESGGFDPSKSGPPQLVFGQRQGTDALPYYHDMGWQAIVPAFQAVERQPKSTHIPIPACTVDDQVYHRCPSLVIATVDKFARLAYEPKAASLFGNVTHYHSRWGYYREGTPPSTGNLPNGFQKHPSGFARGKVLHIETDRFCPPDLILQDELHLIEGPLGSMVGLYETAVDLLCQQEINGKTIGPKYVASTATVRQSESQVQALFTRRLAQFPPLAINADDRFFARDREVHPLETERPGRLYVAICAPGKGAQTPIVRIWASLFQVVQNRLLLNPDNPELDRFWTLVGYFNALRELAGALSLYRQDIPERIKFRAAGNGRLLSQDRYLELSSRASSLDLPTLLKRLETSAPDAQDAALATSMFGTGVDVDRLGLMVVHGQPKTTASYIQATGRVGRQGGGLIVTFFRASRPRDLDHYEFFTGYHRALYRYVEPITVSPFSPRARERGLGPLAVILLRQAATIGSKYVNDDWRVQQRLSGAYYSCADRMASHRYDPEVKVIPQLMEERAGQQPEGRRPLPGVTQSETVSELDRWHSLAKQNSGSDRFVYNEVTLLREPERHVVLGDAQHRFRGFTEAFENAPQSLREVEETTGFKS
jgi:hypothetical protein